MIQDVQFPLRIANGDIAVVSNEELIKSQILLYITTLVGELVWDRNYGVPNYLFQSRGNIRRDLAIIQTTLQKDIPTAFFNVRGDLDENGLLQIGINWDYNGFEDAINIQFNV